MVVYECFRCANIAIQLKQNIDAGVCDPVDAEDIYGPGEDVLHGEDVPDENEETHYESIDSEQTVIDDASNSVPLLRVQNTAKNSESSTELYMFSVSSKYTPFQVTRPSS